MTELKQELPQELIHQATIDLYPNIIARHAHYRNDHGTIVLTLTGFCEPDTWYTAQKGLWDNEPVLIIKRLTRKPGKIKK